ncbi:MAG: hypothetical protein N2316_10025 [Spirochaetes bacterium]|nr:hypothetical protein [Spirochaetota bacterium]
MIKKLLLMFVICSVVFILLPIGCAEDEEDAALQNVWRVTKFYERDDETGQWVTETLPMELQGGGKLNFYFKFSSSLFRYFWKISDNPYGGNGVFYCEKDDDTYTVSGNTIIWGDQTTTTYSISGNNLKLSDPDGSYSELVLASESDIAGAVEDCSE